MSNQPRSIDLKAFKDPGLYLAVSLLLATPTIWRIAVITEKNTLTGYGEPAWSLLSQKNASLEKLQYVYDG
ncbi:MAG: hypothetical protein WBB19_10425 [Desulforhopalus sp.]